MRRFAQILHGKAHWIVAAEDKPEFAPNIILVEISGNPEIQEGWDYDSVTGVFEAPVIPPYEPEVPRLSEEEVRMQTLLNTEYLVALSET